MSKAMFSGGAQLIVRGWLSANNVVFAGAGPDGTTAVVDTGYVKHDRLTLALVQHALRGRELGAIVNTHLHSDHCGGNRVLQSAFPSAVTMVPDDFRTAVQPWTDSKLSFQETGQQCAPFRTDAFLRAGDEVPLGSCRWEVHPAPGHDPGALMFFEPASRTLISGDALWEKRLAIIFPELTGSSGFALAHLTLDAIERLSPTLVMPGHGQAFTDVSAAIQRSRQRLDSFAAQPHRHRVYAARALAMFHMLEHRCRHRTELETWMVNTPVFDKIFSADPPLLKSDMDHGRERANSVVESLLADGALLSDGELVTVPESAE